MVRKILLIVIATFIFTLIITPIITQKFNINSPQEPKFYSYRNDEMSFLKTFYLMKGGMDYYNAFKLARSKFVGGDLNSKDVFTWRSPVVFYLWTLFATSGYQILLLFIFLQLIFITSFYLIISKVVGYKFALISLIVIPYYLDSFRYKTAFLFTEWWGLPFLTLGLLALFYKKIYFAVICLTLACLIREMFLIPVVFLLFYCIYKKENRKVFLLTILFAVIFYLFHYLNVSALNIQAKDSTNFITRFKSYNFNNLQRIFSFSMRYFVFLGLKSHLMLILVSLYSLFYVTIKNRSKELIYLSIYIGSLLLILPIISVQENDYWGILVVPMILMSLPVIFLVRIK